MWPSAPQFRTRSAEQRFDKLRKLVESIDVLPSTARVPMRILELHRCKTSTLQQYGEALMSDASLSSRILSLANSAWAGQGNKAVTKISDAIRLIGVNNLMPLLFGLSLAGVFNRADIAPSHRDALWKTALLKATVARYIARQDDPANAEEAFLCALLQDIALPAMYACDAAAASELANVLDMDSSASRERDLYGMTHAEVAGVIAARLKLPDAFVKSIATHHIAEGPDLPAELKAVAPALRIAAAVPHVAAGDLPGLGQRFAYQLLQDKPTTTSESVKKLIVALMKEYNQVLGLLGGREASDNVRFRTFLQDVCERVAHTLTGAINESVKTVSRLESRIGELESKAASADIDSLTGLANRRSFIERGTQILRLSSEIRSYVGIGFADIDNFKSINDQHGHDAGDAALRALGRALKDTVGKRGVVGRLGGDEFAFILVAEDAARQDAIADDLSRLFTIQHCKIGDKTFPVSFSVGVQWLGVPEPAADVETELKRADELMYKAKRAGKNRCLFQSAPRAAA